MIDTNDILLDILKRDHNKAVLEFDNARKSIGFEPTKGSITRMVEMQEIAVEYRRVLSSSNMLKHTKYTVYK